MTILLGEEELQTIYDNKDDKEQYDKIYLAALDSLLQTICPGMNEDDRRRFFEIICNQVKEDISEKDKKIASSKSLSQVKDKFLTD